MKKTFLVLTAFLLIAATGYLAGYYLPLLTPGVKAGFKDVGIQTAAAAEKGEDDVKKWVWVTQFRITADRFVNVYEDNERGVVCYISFTNGVHGISPISCVKIREKP